MTIRGIKLTHLNTSQLEKYIITNFATTQNDLKQQRNNHHPSCRRLPFPLQAIRSPHTLKSHQSLERACWEPGDKTEKQLPHSITTWVRFPCFTRVALYCRLFEVFSEPLYVTLSNSFRSIS